MTDEEAPQPEPTRKRTIDLVRVAPHTGTLYIEEKDLYASEGFRTATNKARAFRDRKIAEAKERDNR